MLDAISTDCIDCLKVVFILNKILIKLNLIEESIKIGVIDKRIKKKLHKNFKLLLSKLFISDLDNE